MTSGWKTENRQVITIRSWPILSYCWWWILTSYTSIVWRTSRLCFGTTALFGLHQWRCKRIQFSPNTDLNLFADDMVLYKCIDSTEDVVDLTQDNDLLSHWVSSNQGAGNSRNLVHWVVKSVEISWNLHPDIRNLLGNQSRNQKSNPTHAP